MREAKRNLITRIAELVCESIEEMDSYELGEYLLMSSKGEDLIAEVKDEVLDYLLDDITIEDVIREIDLNI